SNILQTTVIRPSITETTALGAAYLSGLAVGYWESIEEIEKYWQPQKTFQPSLADNECMVLKRGWSKAVKAAKAWTED
ncbi:MAG: glycerol kinase, partial [Bacteroidota bacterium]|nr:glycerol kinase [Bacteroidota bacterium]